MKPYHRFRLAISLAAAICLVQGALADDVADEEFGTQLSVQSERLQALKEERARDLEYLDMEEKRAKELAKAGGSQALHLVQSGAIERRRHAVDYKYAVSMSKVEMVKLFIVLSHIQKKDDRLPDSLDHNLFDGLVDESDFAYFPIHSVSYSKWGPKQNYIIAIKKKPIEFGGANAVWAVIGSKLGYYSHEEIQLHIKSGDDVKIIQSVYENPRIFGLLANGRVVDLLDAKGARLLAHDQKIRGASGEDEMTPSKFFAEQKVKLGWTDRTAP